MTERPAWARDRGNQSDVARGADRPGERSPALLRNGEAPRAALWVIAVGLAAWLGELTGIGEQLALVRPATGVALVWVATCRRQALPWVLALVGLVGGGVALLAGESGAQVLDAFLGVPLALLVVRVLARRWVPDLWAGAVPRPVETLREYAVLSGAALTAGSLHALLTVAFAVPATTDALFDATAVAITHIVSMLTLGIVGLMLRAWYAAAPGPGIVAPAFRGIRRALATRRDQIWVIAGAAVAAAQLAAGFLWVPGAPVIFVLMMLVVVVGVRFSALATGLYAISITGAAAAYTVAGLGPIASLDEPRRQAVAFGLFATSVVVTGLVIALSRRERDSIIGRLRESEHAADVLAEDLSLVLASLEEGVAVIEEGGRLIHANAALGRLFDLTDPDRDSVPPLSAIHLVHLDGSPMLESEVPHVRAFAGEGFVQEALRLIRASGDQRIFETTARLLPQIRDSDSRRVLVTVRDVTADHQQRDALASFAHIVAHDLRSPLTSVSVWAQELLESFEMGPVDRETGSMMAGHVVSSAERMQNFISDLLSYAMARDQKPMPTEVALVDMVEAVVETIVAVERTPPAVTWSALPTVWADPVLLPQVFDNLIGNARKYVAPEVVSRVHLEATDRAGDWVCVRVADNGIGIRAEDRHRIFGTFERARATEFPGTGLGLAICRSIVEKHGGAIAAVDPPSGFNTCIELTLPTSEAAFRRATGMD